MLYMRVINTWPSVVPKEKLSCVKFIARLINGDEDTIVD